MQYAQLNQDGYYSHQITTSGNVTWGPNHFCPASALTPDEAALFRVVPLLEIEPPVVNPITQAVARDGGELVGGQWQYKWRVDTLSAEQIDANRAAARAAKREAIKSERDRRKALGVKVGDHWFHSDDPSRIQQLALAMMGNAIPAGLMWKTLTTTPPPVFVTMTPALAQGIFMATAASDAAIFAAAETHRVAMEAMPDPENYDCTTGWPASIEDEA